VLLENLLRRGAVVEIVVDARRGNPVPVGRREIETVRAKDGVILAILRRRDQQRDLGSHRLAAPTKIRAGAGAQAKELDAGQRLAVPGDAARRRFRLRQIGHQRRSIRTAHA